MRVSRVRLRLSESLRGSGEGSTRPLSSAPPAGRCWGFYPENARTTALAVYLPWPSPSWALSGAPASGRGLTGPWDDERRRVRTLKRSREQKELRARQHLAPQLERRPEGPSKSTARGADTRALHGDGGWLLLGLAGADRAVLAGGGAGAGMQAQLVPWGTAVSSLTSPRR